MEGDGAGRRFRFGGGISIHSLRMEGDFPSTVPLLPPDISIHSLRMEGDERYPVIVLMNGNFNPLPPHGGRPTLMRCHSPAVRNFNPLPPHGGRPAFLAVLHRPAVFQSTPSAWRETCAYCAHHVCANISIHSLRMEGDIFRLADLNVEIISIHSLRMEGDYAMSQKERQ